MRVRAACSLALLSPLLRSICLSSHLLSRVPPSSLPLSPSPLVVCPFPPAAVDREPSPQALKGSFQEVSLYALRQLLKLPSSAVAQSYRQHSAASPPTGPLSCAAVLYPSAPFAPTPVPFPSLSSPSPVAAPMLCDAPPPPPPSRSRPPFGYAAFARLRLHNT